MGSLRDGLVRLYGSLRRKTVDRDLNDEVQFHIDMQTEKNLRLGMGASEARRTALIAFGGRERFKDDARDEARSRLLEDFPRTFATVRMLHSLRRSRIAVFPRARPWRNRRSSAS